MILLSFDTETTGLNSETDQVIEVGAALYSTGQRKIIEASSYLVKTPVEISKRITELTHITPIAVEKFGFESQDGLVNLLAMMKEADAVIGQNVIRFDKRFLEQWANRERMQIPEKLWIDTRTDLPGVESKHLGYMLADIGKINSFPHSALTDALAVIVLVEHYTEHAPLRGFESPDSYLNEMVKLAQSPTVVLIGRQDRADNQLAKEQKFSWNGPLKIWWKAVKECQLSETIAKCSFKVERAPSDITVEQLWYS